MGGCYDCLHGKAGPASKTTSQQGSATFQNSVVSWGIPGAMTCYITKKGSRKVRHEEGGKQTEVRLNAEGLKKKKNAGKDLLLGKGTFSFQAINKGTLWGHKGEAK